MHIEMGYESILLSFGLPIQNPVIAINDATIVKILKMFFHVKIPIPTEASKNPYSQALLLAQRLSLLTKTIPRIIEINAMPAPL